MSTVVPLVQAVEESKINTYSVIEPDRHNKLFDHDDLSDEDDDAPESEQVLSQENQDAVVFTNYSLVDILN